MDRTDRRPLGANHSRRAVLATAGALPAGLLPGCTGNGDSDGNPSTGSQGSGGTGSTATDGGSSGWRTAELTAVRSDETFTIAGFEEPAVMQSFATWCSNCLQQSKRLTPVSDEVTLIGLNNDLDESPSQVRKHAEQHGFDWRFAVASAEMMDSLRSEFGNVVAVAPRTPMIVHCPDGSAELNEGMTADEVRTAVENC